VKPRVALVGRPNVGKSTLFNRIAKRNLAIVEDTPGVTRDRHEADVDWFDRAFTIIDTGGFVLRSSDTLLEGMREQAQVAVDECQVILFVVDGRDGLTPADQEIAEVLRRSAKPVVVAVNKVDGPKLESKGMAGDFWGLGFDSVLGLSAEHGYGIQDLVDAVIARLPEAEVEPEGEPAERGIRVAIVGRPNVGKSTLVNALLRQERFVASALPGTTRDAIDTPLERGGRRFILTDTAGIRRKKTIAQRVEQFAVTAALHAIERSDVAALVLDATESGVDQDARIAQLAEEKGRALLVVVNKWDLVPHPPSGEENFRAGLKERFGFISYAPIVFTSATRKTKVDKVLDVAAELYDELTFRAPTPKLNKLLAHIEDSHPAPIARGKPLRLYYMAQVAAAPPTFTVTCNLPQEVPEFYKRYVVNQVRAAFRLRVPMRMLWRERPGKEQRESRKRPKGGGQVRRRPGGKSH
jgi:GTP-binding protein